MRLRTILLPSVRSKSIPFLFASVPITFPCSISESDTVATQSHPAPKHQKVDAGASLVRKVKELEITKHKDPALVAQDKEWLAQFTKDIQPGRAVIGTDEEEAAMQQRYDNRSPSPEGVADDESGTADEEDGTEGYGRDYLIVDGRHSNVNRYFGREWVRLIVGVHAK